MAMLLPCVEVPKVEKTLAAEVKAACWMSAAPCSVAYLMSMCGPCCSATSRLFFQSPFCA